MLFDSVEAPELFLLPLLLWGHVLSPSPSLKVEERMDPHLFLCSAVLLTNKVSSCYLAAFANSWMLTFCANMPL